MIRTISIADINLIEVAIVATRAVGYCFSTIESFGTGEIDSLHVTSAHRGRGLGRALMENALSSNG